MPRNLSQKNTHVFLAQLHVPWVQYSASMSFNSRPETKWLKTHLKQVFKISILYISIYYTRCGDAEWLKMVNEREVHEWQGGPEAHEMNYLFHVGI